MARTLAIILQYSMTIRFDEISLPTPGTSWQSTIKRSYSLRLSVAVLALFRRRCLFRLALSPKTAYPRSLQPRKPHLT